MMNGKCMCGAVTFKVALKGKFSVCFCKMCQEWASGMFMGAHTTAFELTGGEEQFTIFKSSDWANRAFCNQCGSNIYYHMPEYGTPSVSLGALEDTSGQKNVVQYFIDKKPDGLSLSGGVKTMTEAECMVHFGGEA